MLFRAAARSLVAVAALSPLAAARIAPRPAALREVTIEAHEYAFVVPATVPAGLTAFRFVNRGAKTHEVQFFRFNRGIDARTARGYLGATDVPDSVADSSGSVLIAGPGASARERILVQLERGELYALVCAFRDAPGQPRHQTMGMVGLVEVR